MYNGREIKKAIKEASKLPRKPNPFKDDVDYTSLMGYRDDSPFNNRPYIDINTPNGMIDMSNTSIPLMANRTFLPGNSGMHDLGTPNVREIPFKKDGGWLERYQMGAAATTGTTPVGPPPTNAVPINNTIPTLTATSSTSSLPVSSQAPINPTNKTGLEWVAEKWKNRDRNRVNDWSLLMPDGSGGYKDSGVDPFTMMMSAPTSLAKAGLLTKEALLAEEAFAGKKAAEAVEKGKGAYETFHRASEFNHEDKKKKKLGGPLPDVEKAKSFLDAGSIYGHSLTQKQFDAFTRIVGDAQEESGEEPGDYESSGEYRHGGQQRRLPRGKTSQNIKTSLNFLLARNKMLYGLPGRYLYDPNAKLEDGGGIDSYQDAGTVMAKLKQEKTIRDAAEAAADFKASTPASTTQYNKFIPKLSEKEIQFATLPKAQQEAIKQQNIIMASRRPEAQLSQGKKLTKEEQAYSDKVSGRIANPFHDVGSAAGNIASYLTRFQGLSPEEIANVTNNPMGTLKMSGELGAHALINEAVGAGLMMIGTKAAPYVKHIAEEAPHYLPKVKLKGANGKPSIEFPEYSDYVRIQGHGFDKAKVAYNPKLTPEQNTYTGRWVGDDPIKGADYVSGIQVKDPGAKFDIIKGRMPKSRLEQFKGKNLPDEAKLMSYGPGEYGTWENAFNNGAITDVEKKVMSQYEKNPEKFLQEGSLHKAIYENVVKKIAANPKLFEPSEALLPEMKMNLLNMLNKTKGLSKEDAATFLRQMGNPMGGLFNNIKKYSPFEEGGTTNWLDKYK